VLALLALRLLTRTVRPGPRPPRAICWRVRVRSRRASRAST